MNKVQMVELLRLHHSKISSTQAEMYIEQSANRIAERTEIYKRTDIMSSAAGQRWYSFPKRAVKIDSVYFNDVRIPRLIGEPLIDDDEFGTNTADTADTALTTPTSNPSNERFWMYSPYKPITEGITTNEQTAHARFARLGIVEKVTNSVTRDGRTSNYQSCSVTGTFNIRVFGSWIPESFTSSAAGTDEDDGMLSTVGPLAAIPEHFHEILLTGAIAIGYKYPPNLDFNVSAAFEQDFERGIRRIRKHSRTRISTGFIKPQDF